jgi:hypothetical protein
VVISMALFVMQRPWAAWLLLPLLVSAAGTTISLFTSSRRRRLSLAEHRGNVERWTPDYIPPSTCSCPPPGRT